MKISTLGPEGTFSHEASLTHDKKAELIFEPTIWDIFEAVEYDEADQGVVPIENSISGTIGFTLDALFNFDLNIIEELLVPINHNLASQADLKTIKTLYLHPETHSQCQKFIRETLPEAKIIYTSSNGESAEKASKDKSSATIVSNLASKIYDLKILKKSVQDNNDNVTKFLIISRKISLPSKKDRTTISINPQSDKPGLLYCLLGIFSKQEINLTKIESIPVKGRFGKYLFLIDFEGHKDDDHVKIALEYIEKLFFLRVHGSYPRVY